MALITTSLVSTEYGMEYLDSLAFVVHHNAWVFARCCGLPPHDPIHLIVDSTGLSMVGEGEWAAKYGRRGRQGWKKLHLGVDRRGAIIAQTLTDVRVDDATIGLTLIGEVDESSSDPKPNDNVRSQAADVGQPTSTTSECRSAPPPVPTRSGPMTEADDRSGSCLSSTVRPSCTLVTIVPQSDLGPPVRALSS